MNQSLFKKLNKKNLNTAIAMTIARTIIASHSEKVIIFVAC